MHNTRSNTKTEKEQDRNSPEPPELTISVENINKIENLEMKALSPVAELEMKSPSKQPVAGIFEPSTKAVEIDSSILAPLTSPSEILSIKGSLSLKKLKAANVLSEEIEASLNKNQLNNQTKKLKNNKTKIIKPVKNLKEVRVNLEKLSTNDLLLKKAAEAVKKKVRRKSRFNRTGFPSSKKKKKKNGDNEIKTVNDNSVINETNLDAKLGKHSVRIAEKRTSNEKDSAVVNTKKTRKAKIESENLNNEFSDSENSDLPLSVIKETVKVDENPTEEPKIDDAVVPSLNKPVEKMSARIEEKLNAGRKIFKRVRKNVNNSDTESKKPKTDRALRPPKKEAEEKPVDEVKVEEKNLEEVPVVENSPVRKRKRLNTVKNTNSKFKNRCQFPLLSMKKFKKAKEESRAPR